MEDEWWYDFKENFNDMCLKNKQPYRIFRRAKTMKELKRDNMTRPLGFFERLRVCSKILFNRDLHIMKRFEKMPQA